MSYTPNVPLSGQSLGGTRNPINTNFQVINTAFGVNHIALTDIGAGKHLFLQMPQQLTAPSTASNEGGVYTKVSTNPAETDLFYRGQSSGFEYQLTKVISASTATFGTYTTYVASNDGGWTFLAGGLLLQYGKRSVNSGGSFAVTFPVAFSSNPFSITLAGTRGTTNSSSVFVVQGSESTTGFSIFNTSGAAGGIVNCYWMAIGVKA